MIPSESGSMVGVDPARYTFVDNPCPPPLQNVMQQPPADHEPFDFQLTHTIHLGLFTPSQGHPPTPGDYC